MGERGRLTVAELHEYALDLTRLDDEPRTVPHRVLASMACEILDRREAAAAEFGRKVLEPIVKPIYERAAANQRPLPAEGVPGEDFTDVVMDLRDEMLALYGDNNSAAAEVYAMRFKRAREI